MYTALQEIRFMFPLNSLEILIKINYDMFCEFL